MPDDVDLPLGNADERELLLSWLGFLRGAVLRKIDGLSQRLDIVSDFSGRVGEGFDPLALLDSGLGPLASADTSDTIARAESRAQALTLLLMAPEFLRR